MNDDSHPACMRCARLLNLRVRISTFGMRVPGYANKTSNMLVRLAPVARSILDVKRQEVGRRCGWGWAERQSST